MIFHENRLLADDSHEISKPYFCRNLGKMSQNLLAAARVNSLNYHILLKLDFIPDRVGANLNKFS